jgi:hypothetical protein
MLHALLGLTNDMSYKSDNGGYLVIAIAEGPVVASERRVEDVS